MPEPTLKDYTIWIKQYADHLHEEHEWLDEADRVELQILNNRIEKLSNDVQARIDDHEERTN